MCVSNQLSRQVEQRADAYAMELTQDAEAQIDFERRVAVTNVADVDPPDWAHFLLGTHPTTLERIGAGVAFEREQRGG
jgi:STE24 endopeptidase